MAAAPPQRRRMTAFARRHSVARSGQAAAASPAPSTATAPAAANIAAEVQTAVETALGAKLAPGQPLMEAGMDSLGAPFGKDSEGIHLVRLSL